VLHALGNLSLWPVTKVCVLPDLACHLCENCREETSSCHPRQQSVHLCLYFPVLRVVMEGGSVRHDLRQWRNKVAGVGGGGRWCVYFLSDAKVEVR
jgi:hypothetical protein